MKNQVFFEDVDLSTIIPILIKHPTSRQLVKWSCVTDQWLEIHYDQEYCKRLGLPGVNVQGSLIFSFLGKMITDWIGEEGNLIRLSCSFRKMHFVGEDIICKGKVKNKIIKGNIKNVECEIWAENTKKEITTIGTAVVTLPSKEL